MSTVYLAMNERANRQWAIRGNSKERESILSDDAEETSGRDGYTQKDWIIPICPKIADVLECTEDIFS